MKNAYDLCRELIVVFDDLDRLIEQNSKATRPTTKARLEKEIDRKEVRMMEIKNQLKNMEV